LQKLISQRLAASTSCGVADDEVPCGTELDGWMPCGTDDDGWEETGAPVKDKELCVGAGGGREARGRA